MRPEELAVLLRRRPFVPIRIHITDGMTYDIRHPENVMVLRARVDIGVGGDPVTGVIDRVDFVSLLHVVRVEDLPAVVPPSGNGQTS
jgi:hypothetical protein